MNSDVVSVAVELAGADVTTDDVLEWLAGLVRSLRGRERAECGAAGTFSAADDAGTVEINPRTKQVLPNYSGRVLAFDASEALNRAVGRGEPTEEVLASLAHAEEIPDAFGKALAIVLIREGRAALGNFGTWTIGRLPDLQPFVRFRPRPAINAML